MVRVIVSWERIDGGQVRRMTAPNEATTPPRRSRHWVWPALLAVVGGLGGSAAPAAIPPLSWVAYLGHYQAGPDSTVANHGYAPPEDVESIPVQSYTASVQPKAIGVQFLDASARELKRQHLVMTMKTAQGRTQRVPVEVSRTGFVGYRPPHPLAPGRYTFRVGSLQLGYTPSWTVTIDPTLTLPAPSADGLEALALLNQVRAGLGLNPAVWSANLALAAGRHAQYVAHWGYNHPSFHVEKKGPLYFGTYPWDRDLRAGWMDASTGEVGIASSRPVAGPEFVAALLDTVYHRLGLLSANLTAVGMQRAQGAMDDAAMMDTAYGYRQDLPLAIAFPPAGAVGVPTDWYDNEDPDPVPNGQGGLYGYPITLDCPTVSSLGAVAMELVQGGVVVPTYMDRPGQGDMQPNQVALVPKSPLKADATYEVAVVSQNVRFNDGSLGVLDERWTFTTGGSQSVYAAVFGRRVMAAVDTPGGVSPAHSTTVTVIFRRGARSVRVAVRVGPSGVGWAALPALGRGVWTLLAVTPSGNQSRSVAVLPQGGP